MRDRELERLKTLLETALADKRKLVELVEEQSTQINLLKTELDRLLQVKEAKEPEHGGRYRLPKPDVRWEGSGD